MSTLFSSFSRLINSDWSYFTQNFKQKLTGLRSKTNSVSKNIRRPHLPNITSGLAITFIKPIQKSKIDLRKIKSNLLFEKKIVFIHLLKKTKNKMALFESVCFQTFCFQHNFENLGTYWSNFKIYMYTYIIKWIMIFLREF